jgi:hypothetical protein
MTGTIELPPGVDREETKPEAEPQAEAQKPQEGPPPPKGGELDVILRWDPKIQSVRVIFDSEKISNWDFVLGMIEMGKNTAGSARSLVFMQNVQNAQAQQAALQGIADQVMRGPGRTRH